MKPSIGRKVYCVYQDDLNEEEVGYLGKDSFIVDDFSELRRFDSLEYFYDDYQVMWFTSFARAKKTLLSRLNAAHPGLNFTLTKVCDGYWTTKGIRRT